MGERLRGILCGGFARKYGSRIARKRWWRGPNPDWRQGSEYPAVLIPLSTQHYPMLQRNLVYTGVTRGKRLGVLLGQRKALEIAVKGARTRRRWLKLGEWLGQAAATLASAVHRVQSRVSGLRRPKVRILFAPPMSHFHRAHAECPPSGTPSTLTRRLRKPRAAFLIADRL